MLKRYYFCFVFCLLLASYNCFATQHSESYVKTDYDTQLFVHQMGNGADVVILHGGPGLGFQYMYNSYKELANYYRVTFFDQRGSNNSSTILDAEHINIDKLVYDLEQLRKTKGIKKMHLLGHSFGGYIAAHYAKQYPENIKSIIFVASAPLSRLEWDKLQANFNSAMEEANIDVTALTTAEKFVQGDIATHNTYYKTLFAEYMCNRKYAINMDFGFFGNSATRAITMQGLFGQQIFAENNNFDDYATLANVTSPVLVIHGDCDIVPLTASEKLKKSFPNATLKQTTTGHFPDLEDHAGFIRIVTDFLATKQE